MPRKSVYTTHNVDRVLGDAGNFSGRIDEICQRYEAMIISVNPVWSFKESERSAIAESIKRQGMKARSTPEIISMFNKVQQDLGEGSSASLKIGKLEISELIALMESLIAMRYLSNTAQ